MMTLKIVPYAPCYAEAWKQLNEAWIQRYFSLEPPDDALLRHPEQSILERGGQISIAPQNGQPVGVCSLEPISGTHDLELSKLAVDEQARGLGIGRRLCEAVIHAARQAGAATLRIESNTKLAPAIHLYHSLGFRDIPNTAPRYRRVNIQLILELN